jgi:tetratricopeptide (TPR) repeat protein
MFQKFIPSAMAVLLFLPLPSYADRILVFKVTTVRTDKNSRKKPVESPLTVVLGNNYFSRDNGDSRTIYDFEKKRIVTVDEKKKEYTDASLFSDIGFRVSELKNRQFLGGIMAKAGLKENPMALSFSEHIFSMEIPKTNTTLEETRQQGNISFSADGKVLMEVSEKGSIVTGDELGRYIRFLRYTYGGHPAIIRKLIQNGKIPEKMVTNLYNVSTDTITLTLESIRSAPDAPCSLAGYTEKPVSFFDKKLAGTMFRMKNEPVAIFRERSEAILNNASTAYEKRLFLPCMLSYLEYNLQTGGQLPDSFRSRQAILQSDPAVTEFLTIWNPQNKEDAEKSLPRLEKLREKAGDKDHILMIFEANIRTSLGRSGEDAALFLRVLDRNPYICGVYKDLGAIYYNQYETQKAWQLWDLGRRLVPDFINFKPIIEFEQHLVQKYPEFF